VLGNGLLRRQRKWRSQTAEGAREREVKAESDQGTKLLRSTAELQVALPSPGPEDYQLLALDQAVEHAPLPGITNDERPYHEVHSQALGRGSPEDLKLVLKEREEAREQLHLLK
jgi:hypothetical protein